MLCHFVIGEIACRVCSKIVGIGSAERQWGEVKHLKTDKRSNMGHENVKKQSVIYGAACMETADATDIKKEAEMPSSYSAMSWTDADFDEEFDMLSSVPKKKNGPRRVVKCWTEDWEKECWCQQSAFSEQKFLTTYGGLDIFDVDRQHMLHLDCASQHYWKSKGVQHNCVF